MKTAGKVISIFLSIVMILSFSVISFGFSEKPSDDIKAGDVVSLWGSEDYIYAGEADEKGITVTSAYLPGSDNPDEETDDCITPSEDGRHCCSITAGRAGLYALRWESENDIIFTAWVCRGENDPDDGTFKDSAYIYDSSNHKCGVVFSMSEGEREYAFLTETCEGEYNLSSVYLGSAVSVESACDLVRNTGCDAYYNEEYDAVEMYPYLNVTFSEGMTYKAGSYAIVKADIESDCITADIDFLGKSFKTDVTLTDGSSLVKSLSFPENFTPSCIEHYDGTITDTALPDYMIIILTDGTELKAGNMEDVILQNGRSYTASWDYDPGNENGEIRTGIKFTGDLGGLAENEITFRPEPDSIKNTLAGISEIYKNYFVFGVKLIFNMREPTEEYEDWTRADGLSFVTSIFGMLVNACRYYRTMGTHFVPFVMITGLIFAAPLIIIAAIVSAVILIVKHRRKKKT